MHIASRGSPLEMSMEPSREQLSAARLSKAHVANIAFKTAFVALSAEQKELLEQGFGVARFSYNWALSAWEERRLQGVKNSFEELRNQLNAVKRESYPWMLNVPKDIPAEAIRDLTVAFKNFFDPKSKARYPCRKKKGRSKFSFRLPADRLQFREAAASGKTVSEVRLSSLGWVRLAESFVPIGRVLYATVSRVAQRYFISFCMEYVPQKRVRLLKKPKSLGIDLGLCHTLTLSSGVHLEGPRSLATHRRRLARANRRLHRKQRGSKNRAKARLAVGRCHHRIADIRRDFNEKVTTGLLRRYDILVIEDLNVHGLLKTKRFGRSLSDASLGAIAGALERKALKYGCLVRKVDRFFPSSKQCRKCQIKSQDLTLGERVFRCASPQCGHAEDRDVHAAKNIHGEGLRKLPSLPGATREVTPVEQWSLPMNLPRRDMGKPPRRSRKQPPRGAVTSNADWRQKTSEPIGSTCLVDQVR